MKQFGAALLVTLFLTSQLAQWVSSEATVPAFLWSPYDYIGSQSGTKQVVHYARMTPKDLATSVLSDGSWSNLLCSAEKLQNKIDVALVFIGRELKSSDLSQSRSDPSLVNSLKLAFSHSNISMAFPYISAIDGEKTLEASLASGLTECVDQNPKVNRVAYVGSCLINDPNFTKLKDICALQEHLRRKMEQPAGLETDLVIFCSGEDNSLSDGEVLSEIVSSMAESGAKYSVLYASDYQRPGQSSLRPPFMRFLLEAGLNGSASSPRCDGVCLVKSSLLEGLFVGIVLLIILISGLCCMMGIDTPSRFETPEES